MQTAAPPAPREDRPSTSPPKRRSELARPPGARFARPANAPATGERRTVTITGHPLPARRRRSPAQEQIAARPDRVALWAVLLGLFLALVAAVTANAAPL